jgi:hypothetical protein
MPTSPKRIVALVGGVLLTLVGLVWSGQGAGAIKGSFMTGSKTWFAIGLVCLVTGLLLIFLSFRRSDGSGR